MSESTYEYKITFLDEDERYVSTETCTVTTEDTDYPEGDEATAREKAEEIAEKSLVDFGAEGYELELLDSY